MAKITFLGVWMTPDVGETVSFVIDDDYGNRILVDCGTNIVRSLLNVGIDPASITHLVITHVHGDHISGLPTYLFYRFIIEKNIFGKTIEKLNIITNQLFLDSIKDYIRIPYGAMADNPLLVYSTFNNGEDFEIGGIRYSTFDSKHVPGTFGFEVKYDGKKVVYSGDTGLSDEVLTHASNADVLIHDVVATKDYGALSGAHTLCEEISYKVEELNVKKLIPVHRLSVYDNNISGYENALKQGYTGELFIPNDGDIITI